MHRFFMLVCCVRALSCVDFCLFHPSSRWPEDAQEEMPIFEVSDQGAGEGVLFQRLHQQREASAALTDAQSDRSPGQNLVSEQEDEGEETEQRPFTVLHHKLPALKTEQRLQRLSVACSHAALHLHHTTPSYLNRTMIFLNVSDFIQNSTIYTTFCH